MSRLVIGVGFRDEASAQSIGEVLTAVAARAARPGATAVLAVPDDKAGHAGLCVAAEAAHLEIQTATDEAMRRADTRVVTRSGHAKIHRNVGSVCEAAALAVAGTDARLIVTRIVSADRRATAAAAVEDFAS